MIGQFTKGKTAVFIDAANMFYSQRTLKWRIDYRKLRNYFERECDLGALNFYTAKLGADRQQMKFLRRVEESGYRVIAKEVKTIKLSNQLYIKKGNLDIELVIDALKSTPHFDTFVLMSGDSDFAVLLDELKRQKKFVIVMSTKQHISRELIERAKYVNLKKLKSEIAMEQKKSGGPERPPEV